MKKNTYFLIISFFCIVIGVTTYYHRDSLRALFRSEEPHGREDRQGEQMGEQEDGQNEEEQTGGEEQRELCTICQDNIESDGCKTSCNHYFHKECINQWLNTGHHDCPNCRKALRKRDIQDLSE